MTQAIKSARHLLWVTLGTAALALVMVVLLVFEVAQQREIEKSQGFRSDSVTALAFQFEREFCDFEANSMMRSMAGCDRTPMYFHFGMTFS